jgi:hypothetical protein
VDEIVNKYLMRKKKLMKNKSNNKDGFVLIKIANKY